jgi:hypothetical protein
MYTIEKFVESGSRSNFYKLAGKRSKGFKSFSNKEEAHYAHAVQTALAEHDLAPRVHSEVGRVRTGNTLSGWGYITEVAKTLQPEKCPGICGCSDCEDRENVYSEEIEQLISDIEDVGFYFGDAHIGNVGYVRRDGFTIMVCIDTGRESVEGGPSYEDEDVVGCRCTACEVIRRRQYV